MIFLTVGTLFPFDRLVKAVDIAIKNQLIQRRVFAQIGPSDFKPKYMEYVNNMDRDAFEETLHVTTALISHAGIGSIAMGLKYNKPLLVMPRKRKYREHVNDHQVGTAKMFEKLGHVLVAYSETDLPNKIQLLPTFKANPRENQAHVIARRIAVFLDQITHDIIV